MPLPIIIPILAAAAAAGIGSAVSAHQANQQSQVKADQAKKQQGLISDAAADMDHYTSKMGEANPYIKDAIGQVGTASNQLNDVYALMEQAFGEAGQSYGMYDKGANMVGRADHGLDGLLASLAQHMSDVRNTDYSSQATDLVGRQMNAVNIARGVHGSGAGNANVAGALARVNAEDAGRRQDLISQLLNQQGNVHMGRGQLAQLMGGLAAGRNQVAATQGQIAGTMGDVRTRQGQMAGMQGDLASMLAQIAGQQASIMGQKGNLYAGEAFSNPTQAVTGSPFWAGIGGAFGGAAQGMGAQISTPFGMAEWMKMFDLGNQQQFTPGQQQFNDWYTENAFTPKQGGY